MKISMYPATSTLIKKNYTKRVHGNLVVPVTVMHFLAMVHGYVHVRNITVK